MSDVITVVVWVFSVPDADAIPHNPRDTGYCLGQRHCDWAELRIVSETVLDVTSLDSE